MRKVRVYIASPYSNGDKEELVKKHFEVAYHLLKMGFNPYAPLYNHFLQIAYPDLDKNFPWLELDKEWLEQCDMLVRFHFTNENNVEIFSPGADEEEAHAKLLGIPVFHFDNVEEMIGYMQVMENTIE
jgi:hypothetical protein